MTATHPTAADRGEGSPSPFTRYSSLIAAAACLVSFTVFWVVQRKAHVSMIDLMVYRAEGWAARTGHGLYTMLATSQHLPDTYPPFAALLFTPLTWCGVPAMRTAATAVNLGLLLVTVHLSMRLAGRPRRMPRAAATLSVAAAAVWCEPVWTTMRYGQVNLLIAVAVLWDLTRRSGHRWAGMGIGTAAGIKLTPALFGVFLALLGAAEGYRLLRAGRPVWNPALRQAAVALAAFCATAGVAAMLLPADSHRFWTRTVFEADRAGRAEDTANQSVRGVVARALHSTDPGASWLLPAVVVGLVGLCVAVAAALAGDRLPSAPAWAGCACAATTLLVSPVSWSHHWVWCLPMTLLLGSEALRRRTPRWRAGAGLTAALFFSFVLWLVPHGPPGRPELHQDPGQMLLSAAYPIAAAAFLLVAGRQAALALRSPWPPRSPRARPAAGRTPGGTRRAADQDDGRRIGTP